MNYKRKHHGESSIKQNYKFKTRISHDTTNPIQSHFFAQVSMIKIFLINNDLSCVCVKMVRDSEVANRMITEPHRKT